MVEVRVEKRIVILDTNHGEDVIVRRLVFWTASSLRQFTLDISGPHVGLAKDRIGLIYSCSILSFVLMGMGIERFSIGYSMPRMAVAFLTVDLICAANVRFRSRVTTRYFDVGDQEIW